MKEKADSAYRGMVPSGVWWRKQQAQKCSPSTCLGKRQGGGLARRNGFAATHYETLRNAVNGRFAGVSAQRNRNETRSRRLEKAKVFGLSVVLVRGFPQRRDNDAACGDSRENEGTNLSGTEYDLEVSPRKGAHPQSRCRQFI